MRRIATARLRVGDRIGRDVYASLDLPPRSCASASGSPIRSAGRSSGAGVSSVWIDDGLSAGIEPLEAVLEEPKHRSADRPAEGMSVSPPG